MLKTKAEFDDFYNRKLLGKFAEMEVERQKQLNVFINRLLVTAFFIPLLMLGGWMAFWGDMVRESETCLKFTTYGLFLYVAFTYFYCRSPITNFIVDIKQEVMEEFAGFWGDFTYANGLEIPYTVLIKSKIFPQYDSSTGDDLFCGVYNNTQTTIAEETLYKRVRTKNGSTNVTVFKGIVILLEIKKKFEGQTVVLKDSGLFNIFKKVGRGERIKLEDPLFEKQFEVFGDNQIEARYLLTSAFMERILQAQKVFKGKNIQFGFFDNKLLISIEAKQNMFEISSIFQRTTNRKMIDRAFAQFAAVMEIIDTLQLNKYIQFKR